MKLSIIKKMTAVPLLLSLMTLPGYSGEEETDSSNSNTQLADKLDTEYQSLDNETSRGGTNTENTDGPDEWQEPDESDDWSNQLAGDAQNQADSEPTMPARDNQAGARQKKSDRDWKKTEADLEKSGVESGEAREAAVIETSRPYLLPRLFTTPTAYSLQSYEIRFGGQGNIHHTVANRNGEEFKGSMSVGLGGVVELGYQLDEYYTTRNYSDKILMGYFKMQILKEGQYMPAVSLSAGKNLRNTFRQIDFPMYRMEREAYDLVFSKSHQIGGYMFTFHPGVQVLRDEMLEFNYSGLPTHAEFTNKRTKVNPRLGISWQARPKTLFMYELKGQNPTNIARLERFGINNQKAIENNLGVRYYLRNWLCMDAGIRYYYNIKEKDDEMKLHANFVGVVPMIPLYTRIENFFKD